VPVIAAVGGIVVLGESTILRFALASLVILGGIALVILSKSRRDISQLVAASDSKKLPD
jgi:Flp pilus assembly protein protease CpaA